jgi:hypothetical protein
VSMTLRVIVSTRDSCPLPTTWTRPVLPALP